MTMNISCSVNEAFSIYVTATTGTTLIVTILKDGVPLSSPTYTAPEVATGLYKVTYTPLATGKYVVYYSGTIFGYIDVLTKSIYTMLRNIEDEALGSWSWDKQANTLTMLRQDGSALANFDVVETLLVASRERTS